MWGPDGFLDTAAVLAVMDLVISCDTSIAYLAGALVRRLWIALNRTPEWRWQRQRTDTVWYPTARLFRQETNGDWDMVFALMTDELVQLLQAQSGVSQDRALVSRKPAPRVEVSWGDFLDRIAILEVKSGHSATLDASATLARELKRLQ
jgi:hypothetical protein